MNVVFLLLPANESIREVKSIRCMNLRFGRDVMRIGEFSHIINFSVTFTGQGYGIEFLNETLWILFVILRQFWVRTL